jgi:hypothetical protein
MIKEYKSFAEFYPYYLQEHAKTGTRILHFMGTFLVFVILGYALLFKEWIWLAAIPITGYGFAWIGHFFIEKNKPATFKYPLYSLGSDFVLFWDLLRGKEKF